MIKVLKIRDKTSQCILRFFKYDILVFSRADGLFWFRFLGRGLSFNNLAVNRDSFSNRMGIRWSFKFCNWRFNLI